MIFLEVVAGLRRVPPIDVWFVWCAETAVVSFFLVVRYQFILVFNVNP